VAAALGTGGVALYRVPNSAPTELSRRVVETAGRLHSLLYAPAVAERAELGTDDATKLGTLLGAPLHLPDLSADGLSLVSGRLLPSPAGPTAELVYRDRGGHLVTIFLVPPHAVSLQGPPPAAAATGLHALHSGDIGIAVVGSLGGDELRWIAEAARRSLAQPRGTPPQAVPPPPQPIDHHTPAPART
jgi:anti-sigma factor RsiW